MKQIPFAALRGLILAKFGTQEAFAEAMGMHTATMNAKLNGRSDWSGPEISLACKLLGLPLSSAHEYDFF
mgnify:CR=1 FL=1